MSTVDEHLRRAERIIEETERVLRLPPKQHRERLVGPPILPTFYNHAHTAPPAPAARYDPTDPPTSRQRELYREAVGAGLVRAHAPGSKHHRPGADVDAGDVAKPAHPPVTTYTGQGIVRQFNAEDFTPKAR